MSRRLTLAREAVRSAAKTTDDATINEQLDSIDEALDTLTGEDAPDEPAVEGDRLEELEEKLVGLGSSTDSRVTDYIRTARDHIDEYRRASARDWEGDAESR